MKKLTKNIQGLITGNEWINTIIFISMDLKQHTKPTGLVNSFLCLYSAF